MRRVLILRPEPGASETARRARDRGLDPVIAPLFGIEAVEWKAPEASSFDALLLTSANAVRCGGEQLQQLRGLPVHAVGAATADAARNAGFDIASTGDSGVDRLLGSIDPDVKLLHLAGEDRKTPQARQAITAITVYRAKQIDNPDLGRIRDAIALIHSPRAGRRFSELAEDRSSIAIAAISEEAAGSIGSGWAAIETAPEPTDASLLALAESLCNNMPAK